MRFTDQVPTVMPAAAPEDIVRATVASAPWPADSFARHTPVARAASLKPREQRPIATTMGPRLSSVWRAALVPLVVALVAAASATAVTVLQARSDRARRAQLTTARIGDALQSLGNAPYESSPQSGGSPAFARSVMDADSESIARSVRQLTASGSPPPALKDLTSSLAAMTPVIDRIYWIGAHGGGYYDGPHAAEVPSLQRRQERFLNRMGTQLASINRTYARRASSAKSAAVVGSLTTIALLILAFSVIYRRAVLAVRTARRLALENGRLLDASRVEALTDALTGLPNRRALVADLEARLARPGSIEDSVLALFDLNGFKDYNDTFGHPAGDALLTRLGSRLAQTVAEYGTAYRMGGDEFCVLGSVGADGGPALAAEAAAALEETGEAFTINCCYGVVSLPGEADTPEDALRIADDRMYELKVDRASASRQSTDVLLAAMAARSSDLDQHLGNVAALAAGTAGVLGLAEHEIKRVVIAAKLHDVGKLAIPDSILNSSEALADDEWQFMRQHTLIGEHILKAAPALSSAAPLVRASHERYDGTGYPDRLAGPAIPLAAQIIAVCDAYDAMTSVRPYSPAISHTDAMIELRRCAGSQFDPKVVDAFCTVATDGIAASNAGSPTESLAVGSETRNRL